MREFIDDELERTMMWREDRWCVVVGMIDRETGDFFAFFLEKRRAERLA